MEDKNELCTDLAILLDDHPDLAVQDVLVQVGQMVGLLNSLKAARDLGASLGANEFYLRHDEVTDDGRTSLCLSWITPEENGDTEIAAAWDIGSSIASSVVAINRPRTASGLKPLTSQAIVDGFRLWDDQYAFVMHGMPPDIGPAKVYSTTYAVNADADSLYASIMGERAAAALRAKRLAAMPPVTTGHQRTLRS